MEKMTREDLISKHATYKSATASAIRSGQDMSKARLAFDEMVQSGRGVDVQTVAWNRLRDLTDDAHRLHLVAEMARVDYILAHDLMIVDTLSEQSGSTKGEG